MLLLQVFLRQGQQVDQLSGANPVALEDAIKRNLSPDGSGSVETDSVVAGQVRRKATSASC